MRDLGTSVLALLLLAACSSDKSTPPPNAGTLIVHALFTAGPVGRNGHDAVEQAMQNAEIRVVADGTAAVNAKTDEHGNARFVLAPGRYVARLVDTVGCNAGAYPARVRLPPHGNVRVQVTCTNP